jgi:hypothetical protein
MASFGDDRRMSTSLPLAPLGLGIEGGRQNQVRIGPPRRREGVPLGIPYTAPMGVSEGQSRGRRGPEKGRALHSVEEAVSDARHLGYVTPGSRTSTRTRLRLRPVPPDRDSSRRSPRCRCCKNPVRQSGPDDGWTRPRRTSCVQAYRGQPRPDPGWCRKSSFRTALGIRNRSGRSRMVPRAETAQGCAALGSGISFTTCHGIGPSAGGHSIHTVNAREASRRPRDAPYP